MKIKISILLIIIFQLIGYTACSQKLSKKNHNLNVALRALRYDKDLKNASISFYAIDTKTKEVLASHNSNLAISPASTQKLITSATALEILGKNYRFKTKIKYTGTIDTSKNILNGNIIVLGGGDPTLGSRYFTTDDTKKDFLHIWAKKIKDLGIDSINGYIIADARAYSYDMVPTTWSWEDMSNYFGAGACGLTVYDNSYTLYFKTSSIVGGKTEITKIEPNLDSLKIENTVISANTRSDLSYIYGQPYSYNRYIRGKLPKAKNEYKVKGSLPDPALLLIRDFEKTLKIYGISAKNTSTTLRLSPELKSIDSLKQKDIFIQYSPKLSEIIEKTNHKSINLFAEHLLNHISYKKEGLGETKRATNYVENFWQMKGMNTGGLSLNDGSGLSRYNTVTAKQFTFVLAYMRNKSKNYDAYYKSIPIVGKTGTVRRMCRGTLAQNNMHAKSGTIRGVKSYAGYVKTKSGREVAFSITLNNFNCSSGKARKKIEQVLIALANFNL